jgi:hypothetical protein
MRAHSAKHPVTSAAMCGGVLVALAIAVAACTTDSITNKEDSLAAAGFTIRPANTPKREAMLRSLPANKFLKSVHGNNVTYVYADPVVCGCLYVGSQKAYGNYQAVALQEKIANRRLIAAEFYQDASWNWGEWGPWGGYYGNFGAGPGW